MSQIESQEQEFSFKSLFVPLTTLKAIHWIIFIGFIVFGNSLFNGFVWDDESFVTKNVYVQQFNIGKILTSSVDAGQGFKSNYYRPLTSLTFATDALIWKQNAFGFHLTNLVFHILSCIFLFLLLTDLGLGKRMSFVVSLIFLVHPVQTEAVTYISSRGDPMYAFFLFAALYCFLQGIRKQSSIYWIVCVFCFLASILSKESAIMTAILFPLLGFMESLSRKQHFFSFIKKQKKTLITLSSIGVILFSYLFLRLTVFNFANTLNFYTPFTNLPHSQQIYATHLDIRLLTFAKILWTYISILLLPYHLHMYRQISYVTSFFSPWVATCLLLVLGITILSIYEIRKYKKAFIIFGFLLAVTTLFPVSGIIPINWFLFEHWLYVPLVGFFIILFRTYQILIPQLQANKLIKEIITKVAVGVICIYMALTIYQNSLWSDPIKLFTYILQFTETAPIDNNLGMSYAENGDSEAAIYFYKRSLNIQAYPQTFYNLGIEYKLQGKYDLAEEAFQKTLMLNPNFSAAKDNLVIIYLRTGLYDKALQISNNNPEIEEIINSLKIQGENAK